jgi:DNA-binding transcriptional MerR regulator
MNEKLLTMQEAANFLSCSAQTLRAWRKDGLLSEVGPNHHRCLKFSLMDLQEKKPIFAQRAKNGRLSKSAREKLRVLASLVDSPQKDGEIKFNPLDFNSPLVRISHSEESLSTRLFDLAILTEGEELQDVIFLASALSAIERRCLKGEEK